VLPASQQILQSEESFHGEVLRIWGELSELYRKFNQILLFPTAEESEDVKRKHAASSMSTIIAIEKTVTEAEKLISSNPKYFGTAMGRALVSSEKPIKGRPIIDHCKKLKELYQETELKLSSTKKALRKFMADNHIVPFRMGFEFQMGGDVLPWTREVTYNIQKTPLFEMKCGNKKLWHAEIDGTDIEFVTVPFAFYEREDLANCMKSINIVLNSLEKIDPQSGICFEKWLTQAENDIKTLKSYRIERTNTYFDFNINERKLAVTDKEFEFAPQITIQFPLKYAVDICCHLQSNLGCVQASLPFSFRSSKREEFFEKSSENVALFRTALGGLMFLQAHTMHGMMTPSIGTSKDLLKMSLRKKIRSKGKEFDEEKDCPKQLEIKREIDQLGLLLQTINDNTINEDDLIKQIDIAVIEEYSSPSINSQFDAKSKLRFMSRRPFSEMLKDIQIDSIFLFDEFSRNELLKKDYASLFREEMNLNRLFLKNKVLDDFRYAVYAEQFYDEEGRVVDCSELYQYFDNFERRSGSKIENLLKRGIIATTVIRHLNMKKPTYLFGDNYSEVIIESVANPYKGLSLTKDSSSYSIKEDSWNFDLLSPPFPLCRGIHSITPSRNQDGMGAYNATREKYITDDFGAAIIEFRRIDSVNEDFINKYSDESSNCKFLHFSQNFEKESIALFNCINDIENEDNLNYTETRLLDSLGIKGNM
jgi:hypothetical protein